MSRNEVLQTSFHEQPHEFTVGELVHILSIDTSHRIREIIIDGREPTIKEIGERALQVGDFTGLKDAADEADDFIFADPLVQKLSHESQMARTQHAAVLLRFAMATAAREFIEITTL